jgi:hypothetical protein
MVKRSSRNLVDRVWLQQRGLDLNGDPLGEWETARSSADDGAWSVQIIRLKGGEPVMAQRLQGVQPVIIVVRASSVTRSVDNAWRAVGVLDHQIYEVTNANLDDTRAWVEILATGKAGDRAEI